MERLFTCLTNPVSFPLRWGIIGLGRAGLAKIKALHALGTDLALIQATVSRRGSLHAVAPTELVSLLSPHHALENWELEDLFTSPLIDAIAICSENELHSLQIQKALTHNKHVLVDFPLCTNLDEIDPLFQLSQSVGCLLHLEMIGLLSPRFQTQYAHHQIDPITHWETHFQGGSYRWIQDEIRKKRAVHLAFARLYQIHVLFEHPQLKSVSFSQKGDSEYRLELSLATPSTQIHLIEHRSPNLKRTQTQTVICQSGVDLGSLPTLTHSTKPLFQQDLELFYTHLKDSTSSLNISRLKRTYQMIQDIEKQINL